MRAIDETGNRYGMLEVLRRYPGKAGTGALWVCRCDCGAEVLARGIDLRAGNKHSCGCLKEMPFSDRKAIGMWKVSGWKA